MKKNFPFLLTFLVFPLGIYRMWKTERFTEPVRIAVTVSIGLVYQALLVFLLVNLFLHLI